MQDINFDGWLDIAVAEHGGARTGYWHRWVYNPKTQQFETTDLTRELSKIACSYKFEADPKTQRITLMRPSSVNHRGLALRVVDGQLVFRGSRWHWHDTAEKGPQELHNPPDRWKEPRVCHSPLTLEYDLRIDMFRGGPGDPRPEERIFSSNGGYWFRLATNVDERLKAATSLMVYNERGYCICIHVLDTDHRYRAKAKWINEKLIYFEWSWSRVLGGYLIFDVESEQILQKEFVHDGRAALEQSQEAKRKG